MAIPTTIKELANKVRNAVYGSEVRESIAKSMEVTGDTAQTAKETSNEAIEVTEQLLDGSFDEGVLNTNIEERLNDLETEYSPRLSANESAIKDKVDTSVFEQNKQEVTSQLAETVEDLKQRGVNVIDLGSIGDWNGESGTDNFNVFKDVFAYANDNNYPVIIPYGKYYVDNIETIQIKTDVYCFGEIIPSSNRPNYVFEIVREHERINVNSNTLTGLLRHSTHIGGLSNFKDYDILIKSQEELIKRNNPTNDKYLKHDISRIVDDVGGITPALDCTYLLPTGLEIYVLPKERKIKIVGLNIYTKDSSLINKRLLKVSRSNVDFDMLIINNNISNGLEVGVSVEESTNVTFNRSNVNGVNEGLGYGITLFNVADIYFNDSVIGNCTHAISGRHTKRAVVDGGVYESDIDTHWGNNFKVLNLTLKGSVIFAGTDVSVKGIKHEDNERLLILRNDTPEVMGTIEIGGINVRHNKNYYQLLGYDSANLNYDFGRTIENPYSTNIENIDIDIPSHAYVVPYILGKREYTQKIWGEINVKNITTKNNNPIYAVIRKNSDYFINGDSTKLRMDDVDFNGSSSSPFDYGLRLIDDGEFDDSWGLDIILNNCSKVSTLMDASTIKNCQFNDCEIYMVTRDKLTSPLGLVEYNNSKFKDTFFSQNSSMKFNNNEFEGTIQNLSAITVVSGINNLAKVGTVGYDKARFENYKDEMFYI